MSHPTTTRDPADALPGYFVETREPLALSGDPEYWYGEYRTHDRDLAIAFYLARTTMQSAVPELGRRQVRLVERKWDYDPLTELYTADDFEILPPAWSPEPVQYAYRDQTRDHLQRRIEES